MRCVLSHFSHAWLFATPWTVAPQALLSMGFSRQEYWSGVPFPSPGDLPDPGIEPRSPALEADTLTSEPPGKRCANGKCIQKGRRVSWAPKPVTVQHELSQSPVFMWEREINRYLSHCLGLNYISPKFVCWILIPRASEWDDIGDRVLTEVIQSKRDH